MSAVKSQKNNKGGAKGTDAGKSREDDRTVVKQLKELYSGITSIFEYIFVLN